MSPSTGFLEDVLVDIGKRTAELCPKIIRGHGIEFLENRCLVLKCTGMRGVLMKDRDTVDDEGEDVSNVLVVTYGIGWLFVAAMAGKTLSKRAVMVRFFDRTIKKAAMPLSSFSSPVSL
jgi:hypothetical protein